jgi:hypothetical protein
MTWQPIETAPRDGTIILGVMAGNHPETGKPFVPAVVSWDEEFGWLEGYEDLEEYKPHDWPLTHWMPLPEPPQ